MKTEHGAHRTIGQHQHTKSLSTSRRGSTPAEILLTLGIIAGVTVIGMSQMASGFSLVGIVVPLLVIACACVQFGLHLRGFLRQEGAFDEENHPLDVNLHKEIASKLFEKRQRLFRQMCNELSANRRAQLPVRLLMSTKVAFVSPHTPLRKVQERLKTERFHHLLVCGEQRELLGVISDRDLSKRSGHTAQDVMTANPLTVESTTPLITTVTLMMNYRISCLPVVDNGKLVGILSNTDIMLAFQCLVQMVQSEELLPDIESPALV